MKLKKGITAKRRMDTKGKLVILNAETPRFGVSTILLGVPLLFVWAPLNYFTTGMLLINLMLRTSE